MFYSAVLFFLVIERRISHLYSVQTATAITPERGLTRDLTMPLLKANTEIKSLQTAPHHRQQDTICGVSQTFARKCGFSADDAAYSDSTVSPLLSPSNLK